MRQGSTEGKLAQELIHLSWERHRQRREGGTKDLSVHLLYLVLTFPNLFKDPKETGLISKEICSFVSHKV